MEMGMGGAPTMIPYPPLSMMQSMMQPPMMMQQQPVIQLPQGKKMDTQAMQGRYNLPMGNMMRPRFVLMVRGGHQCTH